MSYLCAGIPLFKVNKTNGKFETLLVKTPAGHYSMPKGKRHSKKKSNKWETDLACAYRETEEETGVKPEMIKLIDENKYQFIENTIIYYLGIFTGDEKFVPVCCDPEELVEAKWHDVEIVLTFNDFEFKPRRREIISECYEIVKKYFSGELDLSTESKEQKEPIHPTKAVQEGHHDAKQSIGNSLKSNKHLTHLSKQLSFELRHNLYASGIALYKDENGKSDGSVKLVDLMKLVNASRTDIMSVVENNDKKRFVIIDRKGIEYIRAAQGHNEESGSLIEDDKLMNLIIEPYPICFHGTFTKYVGDIKKTGLNRMSRKHIHLTNKLDALSGIRHNTQSLIFIDMDQAMKDGIKFYESSNGVILSEGIDGVIHPKYISKIEHK
ncbi:MAG: hypothetical protein Terrestrivirus2_94 [Terrestrivirus sp.]|uniref:Nudix hydrolase domain-containing protein n=1 Tax=Terrestrivirus sp. TaxID=2487775 RepID=A0A3G4ZL81_9VIRU|nr:MAG: hypothetical protein Terrestrivirus2_94 [Terrestrivirus sp.]